MKWETPGCNLCGSESKSIFLKDVTSWEHEGKFQILKCNKCGLIFLSPRPTVSEIGKYYPKQTYWGKDVSRDKAYDVLYGEILKWKTGGLIFDVGAGTGLFLSKFKDLGWKVSGNELSRAAVKYAKETHKIKLHQGAFPGRLPRTKFDVVTFNNSLEHLFDPMAALLSANKLLKRNGLVVVTVPNIDSVGERIFGGGWYAIQPPRHLYHFSEETLTEMISRTGFKVLGINRWYWVHNFANIFESFRIQRSPKFRKDPTGRLATSNEFFRFSAKKEIGKIIFKSISITTALIGSLLHKSETICMVAQKI